MLARDDLFRRPDEYDFKCDLCRQRAPHVWQDRQESRRWLLCANCIRGEDNKRLAQEAAAREQAIDGLRR